MSLKARMSRCCAQYLCSIPSKYGHTDGYKSAAALSLSNLSAPHCPMARALLTPGSNRPAARCALTGVASPCPEFYVREERENTTGASTASTVTD